MSKLCLLYKANPWTVYKFGDRWTQYEVFKSDGVTWPYGEIRGGTAPVLIGDLYFTFHHSSLPWRGRYRRYYAGAIGFEPFPPYTPRLITREPLLQGSQNDQWTQRKPLVVFPCGALFINGNWLVSLGVNDIKAAWLELSHKSLLERMVPVEDTGAEIFQKDGSKPAPQTILSGGTSNSEAPAGIQNGVEPALPPAQILSKAEIAKQNRRAGAARARAARMAKRQIVSEVSQEIVNGQKIAGLMAKPTKRRRKRRKRASAESRQKALGEYLEHKTLASVEIKE